MNQNQNPANKSTFLKPLFGLIAAVIIGLGVMFFVPDVGGSTTTPDVQQSQPVQDNSGYGGLK